MGKKVAFKLLYRSGEILIANPTFSDDMLFLRKYYDWDETDVAGIENAMEGNAELSRYFSILVAAHRAGYRQHAGNGFIRLQAWCNSKGLPDPFSLDFDIALLKKLKADS